MTRIRLDQAVPMNGAQLETIEEAIRIRTHPASGGYSAFLPVEHALEDDGPAEFITAVEVLSGALSVAAVTHDMTILAERFCISVGKHVPDIGVPAVQRVAGLLIRNAATRGLPSEAILLGVDFRRCSHRAFVMPPRPVAPEQFLLPLRRRVPPFRGTEARPVEGGGYRIDYEAFSTASCAVVVMDAWANHPCDGSAARICDNIRCSLRPALDAFRSMHATVIHASHDWDIHETAQPAPHEVVIKGSIDHRFIAQTLRVAGISTLIYMGYASNRCMMTRPIGIMNMWCERLGIILVRDASIAEENAETYNGLWAHRTMVDFVEATIGATVSADEICTAAARL